MGLDIYAFVKLLIRISALIFEYALKKRKINNITLKKHVNTIKSNLLYI